MLQMVELFKEARDFLDVDETPAYDNVDYTPIASDRFVHAEATLSLATDVAHAINDQQETEPVAPEVVAD